MSINLKQVHVSSRYRMEEILNNPNVSLDDKTAIISITDVCGEPLKVDRMRHSCHLLPLEFHDTEKTGVDGLISFTQEQAQTIVAFVKEVIDKGVTLIICHCVAGMSRSAGAAAAIAKFYFNDDTSYFTLYTPNTLVYRLVLNAFHGVDYGDTQTTSEFWSKA